jgi:hypothetical protein
MTHFGGLEFHVGCKRVSLEISVPLKNLSNCIFQYLHTHMRLYVHTEKPFSQAIPVVKPKEILVN